MRLTCREVIARLSEYLGRIGHLADCAPCRAYLRTPRATIPIAGRASDVEMPEEMNVEPRTLQTTLDRYGHLIPDAHAAEARKLDRLFFVENGATRCRRRRRRGAAVANDEGVSGGGGDR